LLTYTDFDKKQAKVVTVVQFLQSSGETYWDMYYIS